LAKAILKMHYQQENIKDMRIPITPPSESSTGYLIVDIDNFSRSSSIYFLYTKTAKEVVSIF
jgi:hypothetical protein